jgi:hypothetical protein
MTTQPRQSDDGSTDTPATSADEQREHEDHAACHESVPPAVREAMLDEYSSRCQACGRRGPAEGGLADLHVHHIERDPADLDEHDEENLTVLCRPCHEWLHQQVDPADAPVRLTDADQTVLLTQDIEILRVLADEGPLRTGDVAAAVTADLTVSAVRERLWVLMGLDNHVAERDRQLVDKDVETGEWGLIDQIETSARGHIPEDPQLLLQRMEDEQVRQALDRGCDRRTVAEVLGITRRTTFNKEKRARAYGFPAEAYSNRGGRPTGTPEDTGPDTNTETDPGTETDPDTTPGRGTPTGDADAAAAASAAQQRLDAVGGDVSDATPEPTSAAADTDRDTAGETDADIDEAVREAIAALEAVADALE